MAVMIVSASEAVLMLVLRVRFLLIPHFRPQSRVVHAQDCFFSVGDDALCVKSGK